jgi:protein-tyrosine-phosphatase
MQAEGREKVRNSHLNPEPHVITEEDRKMLHRAAIGLRRDFYDGIFGIETIEQFLNESAEDFASRATIYNPYRCVLWERFARERLDALAKVEGRIGAGIPGVMFLCVHNAGRSQMALGWFNRLAGDRAMAWSGGSEPTEVMNQLAVEAMAEFGIDISGGFPKPWTDETLGAADVVITMGCGDACPLMPGKRYEDWNVEDPSGKSIEDVRVIRDEIGQRVLGLLEELQISADFSGLAGWTTSQSSTTQ